jgi:vacuolar-type H+-ATPase subunit H
MACFLRRDGREGQRMEPQKRSETDEVSLVELSDYELALDRRVAEAEEEARRQRKQAADEEQRLRESAAAELEDSLRRLREERRQALEATLQRIRDETERHVRALRQSADKHREAAIEYVLTEVTRSGGR